MNILVLYATYSGSTQQASQLLADTLKGKGHTVTYKPVAETDPGELDAASAVVFATPTWDFDGNEGMPHEDFIAFMEKAKGKTWENKPFAVLTLGDSSYSHFCTSADHLEDFVRAAKGKLAVESAKIDGFFFNLEKNSEIVKNWGDKLHSALTS